MSCVRARVPLPSRPNRDVMEWQRSGETNSWREEPGPACYCTLTEEVHNTNRSSELVFLASQQQDQLISEVNIGIKIICVDFCEAKLHRHTCIYACVYIIETKITPIKYTTGFAYGWTNPSYLSKIQWAWNIVKVLPVITSKWGTISSRFWWWLF